jgi:N,N'-diacetyllegionaminate synthase
MKIIAELCQNHNGRSSTLIKMVEEAASNGATHVKIQHMYSKNLSQRPVFENGYIKNDKIVSIKRPYNKEFIRLKKLELSNKQIKNFINICKSNSVIPLTTCFTRQDIPQIQKLGFTEIKVASYDCGSFQMLRELKNSFNHIYLSTGASFNTEIKEASKILKNNFSLLHCVTQYPTKLNNLNLSRMKFLKKFSKEVGYSDHTNPQADKLVACLSSIYFGAKILERHFTILDKKATKDGIVSVNGSELRQITSFCKKNKFNQLKILKNLKFNRSKFLGKPNPLLTAEELQNREYYRGRFVSNIIDARGKLDIYNWENTPLK